MEEDETVQEGENQPLRYSVWPNQTLEIPPVLVWPAELEGSLIRYQYDPMRVYSRLVNLPAELYLKELIDLDLQDEEAILGFVGQFGPLGDVGTPYLDLPERLRPSQLGKWPSPAQIECAAQLDVLMPPEPMRKFVNRKHYFLQKMGSIRVHAWCLRDAVRLWQVHIGQMSLEEFAKDMELSAFMEEPVIEDDVISHLAEILNRGLQPFHARLELVDPSNPRSPVQPNLYSALCLQLFNHVAEEAIYLRCHSETCNRLFVRQRGRAKQGKYHTSGVKYCSDLCARAQGQREIRRRKVKSVRRNKDVQP